MTEREIMFDEDLDLIEKDIDILHRWVTLEGND